MIDWLNFRIYQLSGFQILKEVSTLSSELENGVFSEVLLY
jgi:hypothetical protein